MSTPKPHVIKAEAWVNTMPIQPTPGGTLDVVLEFNGNGARADLKKAVPQGINPKILILDLVYSPDAILIHNPQTSKYSEGLHTSTQYSSIQINFEGSKLAEINDIPIIK